MTTNKLFVGGLAYSVSDSQLAELFSQFGSVRSAKVIIDRDTNQGKGFGFVEMASAEEAKTAMNKLDGTEFEGRRLAVKEAKPQEDRNQTKNGERPNRW